MVSGAIFSSIAHPPIFVNLIIHGSHQAKPVV
jgi:hypothetical protein